MEMEDTPTPLTKKGSESYETINKPQKIICEIHKDKKKSKVRIVYFGQNKIGLYRFKCVYCLELESEQNKISQQEDKKCAIYQIEDYQQVEVDETEPRMVTLLPLDETNKKNCNQQTKEINNNLRKQQEEIYQFYQSLYNDIDNRISSAKDKALKYFELLKQQGKALKNRFENIIDCSQMKDIVENNQDRQQLNEAMSEFIKERLKTDENNKQLKNLSSEFKKTNSLYTIDTFQQLEIIIKELSEKISFNYEVQKNNSLSQYNQRIQKAVNLSKINPNEQALPQKGKFVNLEGNFIISTHSDRSETLTACSQKCKAKLQTPLNRDVFYQFVFEIYCNDYEEFNKSGCLILGLGQEVDQMDYQKIFGQTDQDKCNFVQGNKNLSILNSERTTIVMNVLLNKNKFEFTDKNRQNKNIMQQRVPFLPECQYSVFVIAQGDVKITLVHTEEQQTS